MYIWIKGTEHSQMLRRYLKAKFPKRGTSVRKSRYSALEVYCKQVDRQAIVDALQPWKTGAMGIFDNYEHNAMFQGIDPETGCQVIWSADFAGTLEDATRVNVVIDWISVQVELF